MVKQYSDGWVEIFFFSRSFALMDVVNVKLKIFMFLLSFRLIVFTRQSVYFMGNFVVYQYIVGMYASNSLHFVPIKWSFLGSFFLEKNVVDSLFTNSISFRGIVLNFCLNLFISFWKLRGTWRCVGTSSLKWHHTTIKNPIPWAIQQKTNFLTEASQYVA